MQLYCACGSDRIEVYRVGPYRGRQVAVRAECHECFALADANVDVADLEAGTISGVMANERIVPVDQAA